FISGSTSDGWRTQRAVPSALDRSDAPRRSSGAARGFFVHKLDHDLDSPAGTAILFGPKNGMEDIMENPLGLFSTVSAGALAALTLFGCGTMRPGSGPLSLDSVRVVNAIAMDDAGYVRGAVESKVISINQSIPAPAYMEGTPLITVAARAGALN